MYSKSKVTTLPLGTVFSKVDPEGRDPKSMTWYVRADPTTPGLKVTGAPQDSIARMLKVAASLNPDFLGTWTSTTHLPGDTEVYVIPREEAEAALNEWELAFLRDEGELGMKQ